MSQSDLERMLDEWAEAWTSHDIERLVNLFTEDCLYEDVALGAASRGHAGTARVRSPDFCDPPGFQASGDSAIRVLNRPRDDVRPPFRSAQIPEGLDHCP